MQRFISEDPLGLQAGLNLYAYVGNNPTNWIDPFGLDVTLTRWKCCGGADHIGIGVGIGPQPTVGFYPLRPLQLSDPGIVLRDLDRQKLAEKKDEILLKTTSEQDRLMQAAIDKRTRQPGNYNALSGRHCGGFVQEALRAAGIDPFPDVANPGSVFESLKRLNDTGTDFTKGVPRIPR
jgi:uncharacterized protein RhaS with RHS repeats